MSHGKVAFFGDPKEAVARFYNELHLTPEMIQTDFNPNLPLQQNFSAARTKTWA